SRRRHTRSKRDWSSDVCSSDLLYWSKQHGKNRSCLYSPSVVRIYTREELDRETERNARLRAAKNLVRFVDARDPSTANHSQMVRSEERRVGKECRARAWRDQ